MTICHFDEHFSEFFNRVHAAGFAVQHHVAVRTDGNEIIHGIDHIAFADFADGLFVVDFDLSGEFFAKYQAKIKTAYRAGGTVRSDTPGTGLWISFIAIHQDLLLRAFDIEFIRQICIANQLLVAVWKRANFSIGIIFPRGQFRFKVAEFEVENLIQFFDGLIDIRIAIAQIPMCQLIDAILKRRTAGLRQSLHSRPFALIESRWAGDAGKRNVLCGVSNFVHRGVTILPMPALRAGQCEQRIQRLRAEADDPMCGVKAALIHKMLRLCYLLSAPV